MLQKLRVLSIAYQRADVSLRELLSLNKQQALWLSNELQGKFGIEELVILSTCNRTEVYYVAESNKDINILAAWIQSANLNCWGKILPCIPAYRVGKRHSICLG